MRGHFQRSERDPDGFLPLSCQKLQNPIAEVHAALKYGRVFFYGALAEPTRTMQQMLDKTGRGELSRDSRMRMSYP